MQKERVLLLCIFCGGEKVAFGLGKIFRTAFREFLRSLRVARIAKSNVRVGDVNGGKRSFRADVKRTTFNFLLAERFGSYAH